MSENAIMDSPFKRCMGETDNQGHSLLLCPACEFDYVHFGAPIVEAGNDNYEASWPGRGDLLRIPCYCEDGHTFDICLGFHKGNSWMFTRLVPNDGRCDIEAP